MSNMYILSSHELQVLNSVSNYQEDFKLEELKIKKSIKNKLQKSQIDTVKLLAITPILVIKKTGISFDIGVKLIKKAQDFLKDNCEKTNGSNQNQVSRISTGCLKLDKLLGGGIKPGQLIQIFGEYRTGKTQFAHQLCVNTQRPYEEGGIEGCALYLDTDNSFRPERIIWMADALNMDYCQVLKKIIVGRVYSSEHQIHLVREASKIIKKNNIKLIVIDSLIGHFRSEYIGESIFLKRQQRLDTHMLDLLKLLKSFNELAIVVTNQVTYDPNLKKNKPAGGSVVFYNSSIQIELLKGRGATRIAKIVEAPHLSNDNAVFTITYDGIRDYNSHLII